MAQSYAKNEGADYTMLAFDLSGSVDVMLSHEQSLGMLETRSWFRTGCIPTCKMQRDIFTPKRIYKL